MLGLCPISALPIPDELTHMHEYVSHSTFISAHFWRYSRKSGLDLTFVKVLLPTGVFFNTTYTFIFMTLTRSPGTQSSFSNWCTFWFRMLSSWCWSLPSPSQRVLTIPRQTLAFHFPPSFLTTAIYRDWVLKFDQNHDSRLVAWVRALSTVM